MLTYKIPGRGTIEIKNLVLDYNGTIAVDGRLIQDVCPLLNRLKKYVNIYILTADTYGTAKEECKNIIGEILTFPKENAGTFKKDIVAQLGNEKTICIGNGFNDIPMFKIAALSIAVMENEGTAGQLFLYSDIVASSIVEALDIVLNKNRVKATLRS